MKENDPNILLVETVALSLDTLLDRVVFVGGCAVGLLITDTARPTVRATQDLDLIVENGDFGASHDIEDIVNLIDGRPELTNEVALADKAVRNYLQVECDDLLASTFTDVIGWHLGPQPEEQARAEIVIQRMRMIAGL